MPPARASKGNVRMPPGRFVPCLGEEILECQAKKKAQSEKQTQAFE